MSFSRTSILNRPLNSLIPEDGCVILNTIINKNVILVQYSNPNNEQGLGSLNTSSEDPVITCNTRISIDFGKTWNEIPLSSNSPTWGNYPGGLGDADRLGTNGSLAAFIIRHSSGAKILIYTPVYKLFNNDMMNSTQVFRSIPVSMCGWLVHDQNGTLLNKTDANNPKHLVPEINAPININGSNMDEYSEFDYNPLDYLSAYQDFNGRLNPHTGEISPFVDRPSAQHAHPAHNWRFSSLPYEGMLWAYEGESHKETNLVNKVDTIDYSHKGKRYTVVKMFRNVFIRKGNIFQNYYDMYQQTHGFDHYLITLPFIYVYDHSKMASQDYFLEWVDVLNLNNRLVSLENSARGNARARAFIKTLISDDPKFQNETGPDNCFTEQGQYNDMVNTSIYFLKTPHGELLKVHDKSAKLDLAGFMFGNRRYVCKDNPLSRENWIPGGVSPKHYYPAVKRAFAFDYLSPQGMLNIDEDPNAKFSYIHDLPYKEYSTPFSKNASIHYEVASDKVVAIANTTNITGELVYNHVCFIKDSNRGMYSIGFLPNNTKLGYKSITGLNLSGGGQYPVEVTAAKGLLYNTEDFIIEESIPNYIEPYDTVVELPVQTSTPVPYYIDMSAYSVVGVFCINFHLVGILKHNDTGDEIQVVIEYDSSECGRSGNTQEPVFTTAYLYTETEFAANGIVNESSSPSIQVLFTGSNEVIFRGPFYGLGDDWVTQDNNITVKIRNPNQYGFNATNSTFTISLTGDTVIAMDEYDPNMSTMWLAAVKK